MNLLQVALLPAAEKLLNAALDADPATALRLKHIGAGRLLRIECSSVPRWQLWLLTDVNRLRLLSASEDKPDCSIRGGATALASLLLGDSRSTLHSGAVSLSGDTDLASDIQRLILDLDIDWEDRLAPLIGDVPARQLRKHSRRAGEQLGRGADRIQETLNEFLHEESGWLPDRDEIEQFADNIDDVRLRIDRLEARVAALRNRLGTP